MRISSICEALDCPKTGVAIAVDFESNEKPGFGATNTKKNKKF